MVVNRSESVSVAVYSTRRSRSDQQRTPRVAQEYSWIPNQQGCAWERVVCVMGMPLAPTTGLGSVDRLWQSIMVINSTEPVPGAVYTTRRSRISDQQRAPRVVQ